MNIKNKAEKNVEEIVVNDDDFLLLKIMKVKQLFLNENVKFDTRNNRSEYLSLHGIEKVLNPIAIKCGLAYFQTSDSEKMITTITDGKDKIESTIFYHEVLQNKGSNALQNLGATMTYLRRYGISLAFGLTVERDQDGDDYKDSKSRSGLSSTSAKQFNTGAKGFNSLSTKSVTSEASTLKTDTIPAATKLQSSLSSFDAPPLKTDVVETVKVEVSPEKVAVEEKLLEKKIGEISKEFEELYAACPIEELKANARNILKGKFVDASRSDQIKALEVLREYCSEEPF